MEVSVFVEKDSQVANIRTGEHTFIVDEPEKYGGTNQGPDPYDYILGALGACTAITLRLYAKRNEWPLEKIEVNLNHRKDYPDDCLNCEKAENKIDYIDI